MCVLINKSNFVVELKRVPHIMAARLGGGMSPHGEGHVFILQYICLRMELDVSPHGEERVSTWACEHNVSDESVYSHGEVHVST